MDTPLFSGLEGYFASKRAAPVTFMIMRHGESLGNAAGILQGRGNYALSEEGKRQVREKARLVSSMVEDIPPAERLLFSSPQSRARETAELIRERCSFPDPLFLDNLQEMHLGEWTGKTWNEINGLFGAVNGAWDTFRTKSWDAVPGAEHSTELFDRAVRVWKQLWDEAERRKNSLVLAVSHGGLIQWLLKSTMNCRTWFPLFPIHNCGLFVFRIEPKEDGASLTAWDCIDG